jgi:hypothetical protein
MAGTPASCYGPGCLLAELEEGGERRAVREPRGRPVAIRTGRGLPVLDELALRRVVAQRGVACGGEGFDSLDTSSRSAARQLHNPEAHISRAGALYRSEGYMKMDRTMRDGSKGPKRTVHIEHTVPVAVLVRAIRSQLSSFVTPSDLHSFLMRHSVCAALSHDEELSLNAHVSSCRNQAFDDDGD